MRWLPVMLLIAGPLHAQEVKLPAEVRGAPGAWIIVAPLSTDGGVPKWKLDPGLEEVRLDLLLPPEFIAKIKGKVVTSTKPGRFTVLAWNAKGDVASNLATCVVVIGGGEPEPPPLDAFTQRVVDAWKNEPDKAKTATYRLFFEKMSKDIYTTSPSAYASTQPYSYQSVGYLRKVMTETRKTLIGDSLRGVAAVIGTDMDSILPTNDSVVIDDALRARFAAAFTKYAKALEACK